MGKNQNFPNLFTRKGKSTVTSAPDTLQENVGSSKEGDGLQAPPHKFPRPSVFQRLHLEGILFTPSDMIFLFRLVVSCMWALIRLHLFELPFHVFTLFQFSSKQHPVSWPWLSSVLFAAVRAGAVKCQTMGQVRFIGLLLMTFLPFQMAFEKHVKVTKDVKFKVKLDTLLLPERGTLATLREKLKKAGHSDDPMNPSLEYLESMHPQDPEVLANLPEEVGTIDPDGTYTLHGEWIEALEDPDKLDPRPRSKTVILYFHGGGYVFCSTASHRHMLAQLAKDVGPGTRVFSVGFRLAPEHPFPAAIHDAFAAYLYLTEPEHAALILDEDSAADELAVDPKDIVIAGDSGGGNLAAAFMQYMTNYIQPKTEPKFELPHATLLLSPWMDITSSLPSAQCFDWYCYCPGPVGTSPFDKKLYTKNRKQNFGSLYICGDAAFVSNSRNALGIDRCWEWYSHLAQHPLVTPVFSTQGTLKGMNNVLIQSASHDRMVDDSRLIAHRYGLENKDRLVRIEQYQDMVHVHQIFYLFFESSRNASKNLARFIERSLHHRSEEEKAHRHNGETDPNRSYASAVLRKPPVQDQRPANEDYVPAFQAATMVKEKSASDGVEWVLVRQNGLERAGDEGVPLETLIQAWDARGGKEAREE